MDEQYMRRALALAAEAAEDGEVPVGAVLVRHGEINVRGRTPGFPEHGCRLG